MWYLGVPKSVVPAILAEGYRARFRDHVPLAVSVEAAEKAASQYTSEPVEVLWVLSLPEGVSCTPVGDGFHAETRRIPPKDLCSIPKKMWYGASPHPLHDWHDVFLLSRGETKIGAKRALISTGAEVQRMYLYAVTSSSDGSPLVFYAPDRGSPRQMYP